MDIAPRNQEEKCQVKGKAFVINLQMNSPTRSDHKLAIASKTSLDFYQEIRTKRRSLKKPDNLNWIIVTKIMKLTVRHFTPFHHYTPT